MFKHNFFYNLLLGFLAIIILTVIFMTYFSFKRIKNHHIEVQNLHLNNLCLALKKDVIEYIHNNQINKLQKYIKSISSETKVRLTVIDPDGKVLADSEEYPALMENHINREEIYEIKKKGIGKSLRYSATLKETMLYLAIPLDDKEHLIGYLRGSLYMRDIEEFLKEFENRTITFAITMILLSSLFAFIISRNLANPVQKLSRATKELARGNLDTRVNVNIKGELKDLAYQFNYMTKEMKTTFSKLQSQTNMLHNLLLTIQHGIILINNKNEIVLKNKSLDNIFSLNESDLYKPYWQAINDSVFLELIDEFKSQNDLRKKEVKINNRDYISYFTLTENKDIILSFVDVTEINQVRRIKRDFISNVSHELKTPLTAMRGFIETLESEIYPQNRHYFGIIKRHTYRMINIVKDLLILSNLEKKDLTLEFKSTDIETLINDILKIFKEKSLNKKLRLEKKFIEPLSKIRIDKFKIEQVLINLIDNALKYTESGKITIKVSQHNYGTFLQVKDSGIGIPQKHLERIFERFYVVDKSRSRSKGGTGLGLSIVRHIIELHNGEIFIDSVTGTGTNINIFIPNNPG